MDIDLDLYRHEVRVSTNPLVRLSAIDISPDHPQRRYQVQKFVVENCVFVPLNPNISYR